MIEKIGIAGLNNFSQNQAVKKEASVINSPNFVESFKAFLPERVPVLNEKAASELNFTKWKFEYIWEEGEEESGENLFAEITRIFNNYSKKKK